MYFFWLLLFGYCLWVIGYWLSFMGYCLSLIGYGLSVMGYWLWVIRYWLLVIAGSNGSVWEPGSPVRFHPVPVLGSQLDSWLSWIRKIILDNSSKSVPHSKHLVRSILAWRWLSAQSGSARSPLKTWRRSAACPLRSAMELMSSQGGAGSNDSLCMYLCMYVFI